MITIEEAIKESKNKENISNGGSQCFEFGDVVLVKYSCPTKYLKPNNHTRENSEIVMHGVNEKSDQGVNTPKHIGIYRTIEKNNDICYVLQEKCKGINCESISKYGVSFDEMCASLDFVLNIPFKHYEKLVSDACQLLEMSYEGKNKNLFYDDQTGFWFIDFLNNRPDLKFDPDDPIKIFEAIKYTMPKPIQIASRMEYSIELDDSEQQKKNNLEFAIKAKTLLAIKSAIPNFQRYEKFFLLDESTEYKQYLMDNGFVNTDLFTLQDEDYPIFDELYSCVTNNIINKITNQSTSFFDVECNEIRIMSNLFNLQTAWGLHKDNPIDPKDYDDSYYYERDVATTFTNKMLNDIINIVEKVNVNDNTESFLSDAKKSNQGSKR